ncbi:hypothetical protein CEXT_395881 [Caerostris extrusa]|uniref:Uncharacterized protein n=1 Tax=Caerostris extrusa TaxID=172846 RepID=A0AAV4QI48_CAEEX|nr:hypothetical protein CEXT_395881 [Caerostris extrusa]
MINKRDEYACDLGIELPKVDHRNSFHPRNRTSSPTDTNILPALDFPSSGVAPAVPIEQENNKKRKGKNYEQVHKQ